MGLLRWLSGEGSIYSAGDRVQSPSKEDPLEKQRQPMTMFLTGKSRGQRSLAGSSPWGCKRVRHDLATKQPESLLVLSNCHFNMLHSPFLPAHANSIQVPALIKEVAEANAFPSGLTSWTSLMLCLN